MTTKTSAMTDFRFETSVFETALRIVALEGEEALGRPYRFELEVVCGDPALPLDRLMRSDASLVAPGGRRIHGVIAEVEQEAASDAGYHYRLTLVSRLWLLSLDRQSRVYQHLNVVDIVEAAIAATGLDLEVESRLAQTPAPRDYVVQYRESSLNFISRLLEDEGIAYHFAQGERRERLVLCDANDGYVQRLRATTSSDAGGAVTIDGFRCRRQLAPRAVMLQDHSLDDPGMPLQAEATVDEGGFGLCVDDDHLGTPERGARMAQIRAEVLRCRRTRYSGRSQTALAAGQVLALERHFRADLERDYLVTAVHHCASGSDYQVEFEALEALERYRPERLTPRPKMSGILPARVDAVGPGQEATADERGRYRVVMPFDSSGAGEGRASRPIPLLSPDEGMQFTLRRGSDVAWTGIDGDPDRPVIAGTIPGGRRPAPQSASTKTIHMPSGAILEMSGAYARNHGDSEHQLRDGRLASEQLAAAPTLTATPGNGQVSLSWTAASAGGTTADSYKIYQGTALIGTQAGLTKTVTGLTNGTTYTFKVVAYSGTTILQESGADLEATASATPIHADVAGTAGQEQMSTGQTDWIRFAVPHGQDKWSYLRYGEKATGTITPADTSESDGSFTEETRFDPTFRSKYFDDKGETASGDSRAAWSWKTKSGVSVTGEDGGLRVGFGDDHAGSKSTFAWSDSDGILDYTDRNRTEITMGDYQTVTQGNRTDVVLGDYRLIVPNRTNGVFDSDVYGLRYYNLAGTWRKLEWSHVASTSFSYGDTESFFWGLNVDASAGVAASAFLGAKLDFTLALQAEMCIGPKVTYTYGDTWEYGQGDRRSNAESQEVVAKTDVVLTIDTMTKENVASGTALGVTTGILAACAGVTAIGIPAISGDSTHGVYASLAFGAAAIIAASALTYKQVKSKPATFTDDLKLHIWDNAKMVPIRQKAKGILLSFDTSTYMQMDEDGIRLCVGDSILEMTKDGVLLKGGGGSGGALLLDADGTVGLTPAGKTLTAKKKVASIEKKNSGFAAGDNAALMWFGQKFFDCTAAKTNHN